MRKETKKAPTIRFRGFTDDWEQRKLEDIVDKAVDNRGKTPPISEEGIHPLIEVASLGNGAPDYTKVTKYLDDETFESALRDYIKEGDILFSTVGSIGLVSLMDSREDAAIAQNIVAFRAKENNDSKFIYAMLSTEENQYKAWRIVMGAVQPSIKVSQLIHVEYCVSQNLEEQRKIGEYFTNLDHLITLHQCKLDQLKTLKKYFLQNMFPAKGEKVPRIRFKGFTGDWEQRKLGDVFTSLQNNTLSRADLSDEGGLALDIHYGDILIKYGEFLDVSKERIPYLTNKKTIDKFKKSHLQNGDIVVSDTAEDETVGKCTEINGVTTQIVLSGLHTIPLRPVQRFAKGYFGSYLNSEAYHAQLKPLMQGIKVTSISKRAIQDTTVIYPLDLMEQEKIGQYFLSLDHLITLHQRKLNQLQTMKKFMLQNLFI